MTIRQQLTLWYSGLLTLIIIIFAVAIMVISRLTILQTIDGVLQRTSRDVMAHLAVVPVSEFGSLSEEIFFYADGAFTAPGFVLQIWQTHDNGQSLDAPKLVRSSGDLVGLDTSLDPTALPIGETHHNSTSINNVPSRVVSQPITTPSGNPVGIVQIGTPINTVAQANDTLLVILIVVGAIAVTASVGVGGWIAKQALNPINVIADAAANIADADDLSTRLDWDGPMDELGRLTDVFNRMMARLERVFGIQQSFISDVSHELRTPLTSVIGNLELMERYGVDQSSIEAIHREAGRMTRMVNDLLLLARADFGELQVDFYPVDLDAVVLEVYEQALIMANNRELEVVLKRVEHVRIESNVDRVKQLMLNLVGNAIKFTSDGGTISLAVYPDGTDAVIEVHDTGIGISPQDLQRIFDRFFQADASRVHHDDADGAGLGLSIARWIVDIHSGQIDVQSTLGEGSVFIIRLPCEIPKNGDGADGKVAIHRVGPYTISARSHRTIQQSKPLSHSVQNGSKSHL